MIKPLFILISFCWLTIVNASAGEAYMKRFANYSAWSQNLPLEPDNDFLVFIDSDLALSNKLREKWLYQLAQRKDWPTYSKYYRPTSDVTLQCFAHRAEFAEGKETESLNAAQQLWLSGDSLSPACDPLFDLLIKSKNFNQQLISQRIALALEKRNIGLTRYLLKQYKQPRLKDEQILSMIAQNPRRITQLQKGELHDLFYSYGLKRLVSINMDEAIQYWKRPETRRFLTTAQDQAFIAQVALYKAMRNHEDASEWFAKIKPGFYNDDLLDWQIRLALKREEWQKVEHLINQVQDKELPCWQYWQARAFEETGQADKARALYLSLAANRHYYGFLASLRLKQKFSFQNENVTRNPTLLLPYRPFLNQVKSLYQSKHALQASRLLNDFILELPKEDKTALIFWIDNDLQWYGKSVYLSNTEEMNNQLTLRFPLPYPATIHANAQNYHIPHELIYAVIRQESGFRDDAVSSAGARGLMQIMPSTAAVISKQEKIPYTNQDQLFSSQKNIAIGVAYLGHLSKRFAKHPVLMMAAYNAGPRQVNYWLKNHPPKEIDIWIDTLPWRETRNYLKNVVSFYAVYQYRLQRKSDFATFIMQPL